MMRRLGVHFALLFALMFQNIALAMPCCAPVQQAEAAYTITDYVAVEAGNHDETCGSGSPLCCAVPSLSHAPSVITTDNPSSVHVATVHALSISFHQTSPERPPRV